MSSKDWRKDRDDELFPVANEERAGRTYTDEYGVTYICHFVEGLGWVWETWDGPTNPLDDLV